MYPGLEQLLHEENFLQFGLQLVRVDRSLIACKPIDRPGFPLTMKVSKTLLQAIAVAVVVTTVSTSCDLDIIKPKKDDPEKREPYNCPGCGMG